MASFAAGNRDAAIEASLEHTRVLRKEYEARLSGTQSMANFGIEAASGEVSATLTRAVAILIGYLLVAVVIGGFIALWLLQSVIRPIRELVASRAEDASRPGVGGYQQTRSRLRPD